MTSQKTDLRHWDVLRLGQRVLLAQGIPYRRRRGKLTFGQAAKEKFVNYLFFEELAIVDAGIWQTSGSMTFYRNLDKTIGARSTEAWNAL